MFGTSSDWLPSNPMMPARRASPTILRMAESRTLVVEDDRDSMAARHSINKDRERGWLAQNWNRSSSALATERSPGPSLRSKLCAGVMATGYATPLSGGRTAKTSSTVIHTKRVIS
jgi:hypothetical protein